MTSNCVQNKISDCGHSSGDRDSNQHVPTVNTKPQGVEIHKNHENFVIRNPADLTSQIETTEVRNQIENRTEKIETNNRERNRTGVRIPLEKICNANQTRRTHNEETRTGVRNPNGISHRTTYDPPHNRKEETGV